MTMTISEALGVLDALLGKWGGMAEKQALAVIRSRLEVTDEMVERAAKTYNAALFTSPATHEQAMKAALVAALGYGT